MYARVEKPKENSYPTNRQESRGAANSATQMKIKPEQEFGFVDNRPLKNQVEKANAIRSPNTLQRMVLNLQPEDEGINSSATSTGKMLGEKVVTTFEQISQMSAGEILHIMAHFEKGRCGTETYQQLARKIVKNLPKEGSITIDLHGCFMANPNAPSVDDNGNIHESTNQDFDKSFAGLLYAELQQLKHGEITVTASLGAEHTSTSGVSRVRKPVENTESMEAKARNLSKIRKISFADAVYKMIEEGDYENDDSAFLRENQGRMIFNSTLEYGNAFLIGNEKNTWNDPNDYLIEE